MFVDYVAEFKRRCKDKRFTARDFVYDPEKQGQAQLMEEQVRLFRQLVTPAGVSGVLAPVSMDPTSY